MPWSWRPARKLVVSQSHSRRDRQSIGQTTESGGPRGFDAGKKIKGRKPQIVTDTFGHMVGLIVHSASIQDRDGAPAVLGTIRRLYPWLRRIFADGGYAGDKLRAALASMGRWTVQIIKRSDTAKGFELLPRRWVVERTVAWLGRCRTTMSAASWPIRSVRPAPATAPSMATTAASRPGPAWFAPTSAGCRSSTPGPDWRLSAKLSGFVKPARK